VPDEKIEELARELVKARAFRAWKRELDRVRRALRELFDPEEDEEID
jgi:hypothetical protein